MRLTGPERCNGREPAPLLAQLVSQFDTVTRLPAHHSADRPLDLRRDRLVRKIAEKTLRRRGVVVMAQQVLQLRQASNILPAFRILTMDPLKELRGVAQLLEGDPELVAGLGVQPSEMRALPQGLAVQPRQDAGGESRCRFQKNRK